MKCLFLDTHSCMANVGLGAEHDYIYKLKVVRRWGCPLDL